MLTFIGPTVAPVRRSTWFMVPNVQMLTCLRSLEPSSTTKSAGAGSSGRHPASIFSCNFLRSSSCERPITPRYWQTKQNATEWSIRRRPSARSTMIQTRRSELYYDEDSSYRSLCFSLIPLCKLPPSTEPFYMVLSTSCELAQS
jgi:hypothetical protein